MWKRVTLRVKKTESSEKKEKQELGLWKMEIQECSGGQ